MPGYSGQQNQVDINITSSFNASGFIQAKEALSQLNGQVRGATSGFGGLRTQIAGANETVKTAAQSFKAYSQFVRGSVSAVTSMKTASVDMGNGMSMVNGVIANTGAVASSAGGKINAMATSSSGNVGRMGTAFNNLKGYMGGLVKQTISVGDVFGYYIGMTAVQAVYDLTIGMSAMRQEMETTFEYMGNGKTEVAGFSQAITDWAIKMPKISIGGAYEMARVQAMGGNSLKDIEKFKQTWGDMQAIAASLNNLSPEAAAAKIGPAIVDAVSGQYKRLQNVMGVTTNQFKTKAKELGFSNADLAGNYANTMTVIQALLEEKHLAGVSGKLTSFADAWDYMSESIGGTTSKAMNGVIGQFSPFIIALGNAIQAVPAPLLLMTLGFIGLIGGILVLMPIIAALVTSFSIVGVAFLPISSRIAKATMAFKGFSTGINLSKKETTAALAEFKKLDKQMGALDKGGNFVKGKVDKDAKVDLGGGKTLRRKIYFDVDDHAVTSFFTKTNSGTHALQKNFDGLSGKINGLGKDTDSLGGKFKSTLGGSGMTGRFNSMKSGFTGIGTGAKAAALGVGGVSKAMIMFMITNPVGWILGIVSAIILIMTYTNSWGKLMGLVNGIFKDLASILEPLMSTIVDLGTKGWASIKKWEGWTKIAEYIKEAYKNIKGFAEYVSKLPGQTKTATDANTGLGNSFTFASQKAGELSSIIFTGQGNIKNFGDVLWALAGLIINLAKPFGALQGLFNVVINAITGFKSSIDPVLSPERYKNWNDAIVEVRNAWNELVKVFTDSWVLLQPSFVGLQSAFNDLVSAISPVKQALTDVNTSINGGDGGTPTKDAFSLTGMAISFFTNGLRALALIIRMVTIPIKIFVWIFSNTLKAVMEVGKAIIWVVLAFKKFEPSLLPPIIALRIFWSMLMVVVGAVMTLWHWITGNSPGLIPAFQSLLAVALGVFPALAGIITGAINAGLNVIRRFVSSAVSWFRSLPGKIRAALVAIKDAIISQLQAAYDGAMGWVSKFADIGTKIKDTVVNAIRGAFNMHSPSKVTSSLGEMISQGLYDGMLKYVSTHTMDFVKDTGIIEALKKLDNAFLGYKFKFYYNSLQGVSTTLKTMSGNCSDAADSFMAMASNAGIATTKIHTMVNGIGHYVVGLPQFGMWTDPSGILGHGYRAMGTGGIGGSSNIINVYQQGNNIRDTVDTKQMADATSRRILQSVRFGI